MRAHSLQPPPLRAWQQELEAGGREAEDPGTEFNKQKQKHMGSQAGTQNKQLNRLKQRKQAEQCDNWLRKEKLYIHTK